MPKQVYIFSGLGADERVFQHLDFTGYPHTFIQWIPPLHNEKIEAYAGRIITQITEKRPILIGLSFGGMMAIEVAKQIPVEKIILIASVKTRKELPFYFRWAGVLGLHKLVPTCMLKHSNPVINWLFGTTSVSDRKMLKEIIEDAKTIFLKWAIPQVLRWKNTNHLPNIIHIHGTHDRLLPFRFVTCDLPVKSGGHLMTLNMSDELTKKIRPLLD